MKKKLVIGCGITVLVLSILYGMGTYYYKGRFFQGTSINGVICENMTVKEAEKKIKQKVENYSLKLFFKEYDSVELQGTEVNYQYCSSGEIEQLLKKQNAWCWVNGFLGEKRKYTVSENITFDENKLSEKMLALEAMQDEKMILPTDAYIAFENNQFVIKDETIGTSLEKEKVIACVKQAIEKKQEQWSAIESDVYHKPEITKENETLKHQKEVWNTCAAVTIEYTFGNQKEVLDGMIVKDWMSYDENGNYVDNPRHLKQNIRNYVNELGKKYNTVGRTRTITSTATGQPVEVKGGSYGFLIDIKKECAQLLADIQGHVSVSRTPVYARTAMNYGENDIGNTYVEIDLTAQHLWFYKEGKMIMDSDLVSGTYYSAERRTPSGTYSLYYKRKNQVLRPAPNPDGTYDYESPVSYWMPFNGGIGLHDANWRGRFGGKHYLYNGSHGCINLPVSFAGGFYNNIDAGCPIVCFYR